MAPTILTATIQSVDVRQEGARVILIANGATILDVPYDAAQAIARAILTQAARAEEHAKAESIIADQAILTRLGVPFGLTNRPDLIAEAANRAAWDSNLRRFIPRARAGGIKSQMLFGTPAIKKSPPPKKEST